MLLHKTPVTIEGEPGLGATCCLSGWTRCLLATVALQHIHGVDGNVIAAYGVVVVVHADLLLGVKSPPPAARALTIYME